MKQVKHIVCLVTGNINSALSTHILKRKGYKVTAAFIQNKLLPKTLQEKQLAASKAICETLDVHLEEVIVPDEHWNNFVSDAIMQYRRGATPGLGVLYNKHITYNGAVDHMMNTMGADGVASPHFARSSHNLDIIDYHKYLRGADLKRAIDQYSDESALLSQTPQKYLQKTIFPLGDFRSEVLSSIASSLGLEKLNDQYHDVSTHNRETLMAGAITKDFPQTFGRLINQDTGVVEHNHEGLHKWIIGQKADIGGKTFYVSHKDIDTNDITLVEDAEHPALYADFLFTSLVHWTSMVPYDFYKKQMMNIEFRQTWHKPLSACTITIGTSNECCGNDHVILSAPRPMYAITPGQFCTFYDGECVKGSAPILRAGPSLYQMNYQEYIQKKDRTSLPSTSLFRNILSKITGS